MQCAPEEAMKQGKASSGAHCIRLPHFIYGVSTIRCLSDILANQPPAFLSSSGEPHSVTCPSSMTTTLSVLAIVRIRWAMTRTVLSLTNSDRPVCIFVSFSTSRDAVASSASQSRGISRAMVVLPPPDSPTRA